MEQNKVNYQVEYDSLWSHSRFQNAMDVNISYFMLGKKNKKCKIAIFHVIAFKRIDYPAVK